MPLLHLTLKSITAGMRSQLQISSRRMEGDKQDGGRQERGSNVGLFYLYNRPSQCHRLSQIETTPPLPTLLSHPHLPISLPVSPSPPSPPRGGSADSYILGRSRGFLPVSESPAGLWPGPDGQGRRSSLPQQPACTQACDEHTQGRRRVETDSKDKSLSLLSFISFHIYLNFEERSGLCCSLR